MIVEVLGASSPAALRSRPMWATCSPTPLLLRWPCWRPGLPAVPSPSNALSVTSVRRCWRLASTHLAFGQSPGGFCGRPWNGCFASTNFDFMTAHVLVDPWYQGNTNELLSQLRQIASEKYNLHHVTFQLCHSAAECTDNHHAGHLEARTRVST